MKKYKKLHESKEVANKHIAKIKERGGNVKQSVQNGKILLEYNFPSDDNLNLIGDIPKFISPLIFDFVSYCRNIIGLNSDVITINFKQVKKNEIGFVNFSKIVNGKNEIIIDKNANYKILLQYISHELTHIKQINNKELLIKDGYFIWKQNKNLSIKEYNMISKKYDFETYKNLDWEKEAYINQSKIVGDYVKSNSFKNLINRTEEPNLKFILQNAL